MMNSHRMDFHKLTNAGEAKEYFGVSWGLTTKCNYRCSYCHPNLYNGKIPTQEFDAVAGFVQKIFDFCEEKQLKPYFDYGGGEVTYIRWFGDLLEMIHRRGGLVSFVSNGSSPLAWWEKHLHAMHTVALSFHVEQIKNKDHLAQVATILDKAPHIDLQVNVMMLPERFEECLQFAQDMRLQLQCSIALQPLYTGFGSSGDPLVKYAYAPSQQAIMEEFHGQGVQKDIRRPRSQLLLSMDNGDMRETSSFDILVKEKNNFSGWDCYAGMENIVVLPDGNIYAGWCMQDGAIGNIFDDKLVLPSAPMRCRNLVCQCNSDICSTKIRPDVGVAKTHRDVIPIVMQ